MHFAGDSQYLAGDKICGGEMKMCFNERLPSLVELTSHSVALSSISGLPYDSRPWADTEYFFVRVVIEA